MILKRIDLLLHILQLDPLPLPNLIPPKRMIDVYR
jgi:hypothetical protein